MIEYCKLYGKGGMIPPFRDFAWSKFSGKEQNNGHLTVKA